MIYYVAGNYDAGQLGSSIPMTMSINGTATLESGGCVSVSGSAYVFDRSASSKSFYISIGNVSRKYIVSAASSTDATRVITADNYKIEFYELEHDQTYGSDYANNILHINNALQAYYESEPEFSVTQSVMDVMLDFIDFASNQNNYFTDGATYCSSTYLSALNGVGEFSAGDSSGWMYMDGAYTTECSAPMIGSADYMLGDAPLFTWFFTTYFPAHF